MRTCQHCRTENRADAAFCNHCGALLDGAIPPPNAVSYAPRSTNATGRLPPHSTLHKRYVILKNVGQGGMAAVYKATDIQTGQIVAIKEMSQDGLAPGDLKDALDSFRFEAETLQRLRHANLPRVYTTFSENTRHYLVMDFIEGHTLEQRQQAANNAPLPEADVLAWASQICAVLGYLHAQRPPIIFRDLKPANVMVTPGGQIKLIDFGIARVFAPGRTHDTQVLGTPGFAPPEQYGKSQTDARADVYALGCTLYQLLTGYDPATTPFNLPPLRSRSPQVSVRVEQAIERATKLDRAARFPSTEEFARALLPPAVSTQSKQAKAKPQPAPKATMPHQAAKPGTGTYAAASAAPSATAPNMAAIVVVQPHQLDFGKLTAGQRGTHSITISGYGGVPVRGQIKPLSPWLRVDKDRFDGLSTMVQVNAETSATAQTGRLRSELQLIFDNKQLFVPVAVEVAPAPGAKVTHVKLPKITVSNGTPGSKSRQPARRRTRGVRFATSLVLGCALAAALLVGVPLSLARFTHVPFDTPLALALLLLSTLAAAGGALLGSWGVRWPGRVLTTALGAFAGLAVVLLANSSWLLPKWSGFGQLFTRNLHPLPQPVLVLVPLLAAIGAAAGADAGVSRAVQALIRLMVRYARVIVTLGATLGGAWIGFQLTQSLACLTPFAVIAGALLGLSLARLLGLTPRPRLPTYRYGRYAPRVRP
jgi:serine/threonine protein kinase